MLHGVGYAFFEKEISFCSYVNKIGLHYNYLKLLWKPFPQLSRLRPPPQRSLVDK
jgi:hypothetical protein